MDHQLENLGPDRFQQLAQALLISEFPDITTFPISQSDGGRDAIQSLEASDSKFAVFQVKFTYSPREIEDPSKWILEKAAGEAEKIKKLIDRVPADTS